MAETLILSFYPTIHSPAKGLRYFSDEFIDTVSHLLEPKFAPHKKVL
ncbi:MAG: hypothetical protein SAK29_20255 [Scytonema sp. PMC 1069.18]|nr:hypothetical protein [Scytonema sp. PMC 1069.18]MEC4881071.1 hypothetical protein [Scytonema sp. PMC 1070.18]